MKSSAAHPEHPRCRRCGASTPRDQLVDHEPPLARCPTCESVMIVPTDAAGRGRRRKNLWQPSNITVYREGDTLHVERSRAPGEGFLLPFLVIILGSFSAIFIIFPGNPSRVSFGDMVISLGSGLLFFLVVGYYALVLFFRRTYIEATKKKLIVSQGPTDIPLISPLITSEPKTYALDDVIQLSAGTTELGGRHRGKPLLRFQLLALRQDGSLDEFPTGSLRKEEIVYLEHLLEKHLDIVDVELPGELPD